jgi:hypothetical protein
MRTDNFESFIQVADYIEKSRRKLDTLSVKELREIAKYLRKEVRAAHGTY